ncbi:MAG: hypothetical protein ACREEM_26995 [Blastocatellia bacterium]
MSDKQEQFNNPFDFLIDSFWASLPEKTADELATFKKDVLVAVRDTVSGLINDEIECTDRHLGNARKMREQYRRHEAADAPPNPA